METKKDIFVSEIREHVSLKASTVPTRPKSFKRVKFLGKLSPTGMILVVAAIAGSVLISSFFSVYYVQITGELEITGSEAPLFYFDDTIPFVGDTCAVPIDVTAMEAGDILEFEHNVLNADAGYWIVVFDLSDVTYTDPLAPEYGFYFSVADYAVDGVPCAPEDLIIGPGEKAEFTFVYEIDAEMVTPDLPVDVSIGITISPVNLAPIVVDDEMTLTYTEVETIDVTLNDNDPENEDITIVSFENLNPSYMTVTKLNDHELQVTSLWSGAACDRTVSVVVTDGTHSVSETLTVHLTP